MKRWFLTVDWCNKGNRGVFCKADGSSFGKNTQHTEDEMWEILDAFSMILNPQSIELSQEELKEYCRFIPLAEYSNQYGIACKKPKAVEEVSPIEDTQQRRQLDDLIAMKEASRFYRR